MSRLSNSIPGILKILKVSIEKKTNNDFIEFKVHFIQWKQVLLLHNTVLRLCYEEVGLADMIPLRHNSCVRV